MGEIRIIVIIQIIEHIFCIIFCITFFRGSLKACRCINCSNCSIRLPGSLRCLLLHDFLYLPKEIKGYLSFHVIIPGCLLAARFLSIHNASIRIVGIRIVGIHLVGIRIVDIRIVGIRIGSIRIGSIHIVSFGDFAGDLIHE